MRRVFLKLVCSIGYAAADSVIFWLGFNPIIVTVALEILIQPTNKLIAFGIAIFGAIIAIPVTILIISLLLYIGILAEHELELYEW